MRPVKDLFLEEYWEIAFRRYSTDDSVVENTLNQKFKFHLLKATKRFWYADPFLFEKDGKTYLFVEMFDNITEKGVIGYSEYIDDAFSEPRVILEEDFHLSYPYVFEKNGIIYMMPETRDDNCIQLYRAEQFPGKWVKEKVIKNIKDCVDTVILDKWIITSLITVPEEMKTKLQIFDMETGDSHSCNTSFKDSQELRGAGKIFKYKSNLYRPAQDCTGAQYGKGIIFYKINKADSNTYLESESARIRPENIVLEDNSVCTGLHTYASTDKIEIVDCKKKRLNFRRLLWIIKRKI